MGKTARLVLALFLTACVGQLEQPEGPMRPEPAPPPNELPSSDECADATLSAAPTPMRRLSQRFYTNAVRDLLGLEALPDGVATRLRQIPDGREGGFASSTGAMSQETVRGYVTMAEELAADVSAPELVGCSIGEDGCAETFVTTFGRRAFRRPLADDVRADYLALYETIAAEQTPRDGLETMVTAMLASPRFLYLAEPADAAPGEPARLDAYAFASRLSFFLWESVPDDALLDAAAAGALDDPDSLVEEVDRMLADPRATRSLHGFHEQWMHLEHLDEIESSDPVWSDELRHSMRTSLLDFVDHVVENDGTLGELLSAPYTIGDDAVAELMDGEAPDAEGRIALDPNVRAGLLTHPAFIAQFGTVFSEVHRGLWVRANLLCDPPDPPPAEVPLVGPAERLSTQPCMGCHQEMDLIGFGFADYDALGRYRPESAPDYPAAPDVRNTETYDPALGGEFDNPRELADRLASSDHVHLCVATQWFRYATGRADGAEDGCAMRSVGDRFVATGSVSGLMRDLALSDAFRVRVVEAEASE